MKRFLYLFIVLLAIEGASAEEIISKDDADYIFSLDRDGWEEYVNRMEYPDGWSARKSTHNTGTGIMAYDPATGFGLSVQPMYGNTNESPDMIIVGSYYPKGTIPLMDEELKERLRKESEEDLGPSYTVSVLFADAPPFEGVELLVTKRSETSSK